MTFPVLPEWAMQDVQDPISQQYNVVEPPLEVKKEGWSFQDTPNRQWWNWFNRQTYLCLKALRDQGGSKITTSTGIGLYPVDDVLITIDAVDRDTPNNYLRAVGVKMSGQPPQFSSGSIQSNTLALGTGTVSGNQPITGGTNVIIRATYSAII